MNPPLLIGLAPAVGAPVTKDPPKKVVPSVVGDWEAVEGISGGQATPVPEGLLRFSFTADGRLAINKGRDGPREEGTYSADPKSVPAEIDMLLPADRKSPPIRGIYRIKGDTLTLALIMVERAERPKEFASRRGPTSPS
jgi:uncharacterized protein (TIGR03067 family)